ncbi:hypothetical protein, partial [Mesorhizobium sp. M1C.F.Ca.ET.176.01.1.1]
MRKSVIAMCVSATLSACGGSSDNLQGLPRLGAATPATLVGNCATLASKLSFANTTFDSVQDVPAGTLTVAGKPIAEHCLVRGEMNRRVSAVDG